MSRIKDKYLVDKYVKASTGDIREEQSFALSNNQSTAADVTGFSFANATVRSFSAHASVEIDADTDLYEMFDIKGIQKSSGWDISATSLGDTTGVEFSITSSGQIQYTSESYTGFVSGAIKFKALTTSV